MLLLRWTVRQTSRMKSLVWLIVESYVTDQVVLSIRAVKHTVNGIVKIAARWTFSIRYGEIQKNTCCVHAATVIRKTIVNRFPWVNNLLVLINIVFVCRKYNLIYKLYI